MLTNNTYKNNWNKLPKEKKQTLEDLVKALCNPNHSNKQEAYHQVKTLINNNESINIKDINGYIFDKVIEQYGENDEILKKYIILIGIGNKSNEKHWVSPNFESELPLFNKLIYTDCQTELAGILQKPQFF